MKILLRNSRFVIILLAAIVSVTGCSKKSNDDQTFIPIVITNPVIANLTPTSATSGAYLTNFISNSIKAYGVCWSSSNQTPTISDSTAEYTTANAVNFEAQVTHLLPNTLYYLRAYCTNIQNGTTYGDVVTFTTPTTNTAAFPYADVSTYAGDGNAGLVNSSLLTSEFQNPQAIAVDAQGNIYVADSFNNQIRKISNETVSTLAGADAGYVDGKAADARFYSPQGLAVDAQGNVYVSDFGNNAIRKITPDGTVSTFAGGNGVGYADGKGATVKFYNPSGLVIDAQGNIYVADKGNNVIRKIIADGTVSTVAGIKTAGYADAAATLAQFNNPSAVTVDGQGNLYVADMGNNAIRKITTDGTVSTLVGNPKVSSELVNTPSYITIDSHNNLFITDASGRILEISNKNILYSIAGNANTADYNDGSGTNAYFNSPQGIAIDAQGNMYVADYNNNLIRKLVVNTAP